MAVWILQIIFEDYEDQQKSHNVRQNFQVELDPKNQRCLEERQQHNSLDLTFIF